MAWRSTGSKALSGPMMTSSLTHEFLSRPQWVNLIIGPIKPGVMTLQWWDGMGMESDIWIKGYMNKWINKSSLYMKFRWGTHDDFQSMLFIISICANIFCMACVWYYFIDMRLGPKKWWLLIKKYSEKWWEIYKIGFQLVNSRFN